MHAILAGNNVEYFTGVPDSTFGPWMNYLADHGDRLTHRIAINEGSAIAHVAGYHLATGKLGVAYMQNAGLGNCVNPLTSLVDPDVYSIPMLLMVGWRGEPGMKDEPQHRKMGRVTLPVLDALEIPYSLLDAHTADDDVLQGCERARLSRGPFAFVVRKGLFAPYKTTRADLRLPELSREAAVCLAADSLSPGAVVISTTGGISRELFEHREALGQAHDTDFYTVGSMGQASAIAMEVALQKPSRSVCVLDGDGALLMHMGNAATIGHYAPRNLIHVVLDNNSNESTGGQPTLSNTLDIASLARNCGYLSACVCTSETQLLAALTDKRAGPRMVVIKVRKGSRANLGRPTQTPLETKQAFVENLKG